MPDNQYTLETLSRGLTILSLFTRETPTLNLTEIVSLTGINKTTTFRIVSTLETGGYLLRDPETKRYKPGIKVLQLGFAAISSLELRQVARPYLERLSQQVGETVSLSILDGMEIIYIDRVRNRQIVGVLLGLGSRLPAHCTSMGKALLAQLSTGELNCRLANVDLKPCTPKSVPCRKELEAELSRVREQGFALNDEELEIGLRAVAAPVFDSSQQAVAAINVTGSASAISIEKLSGEISEAVRATALQVSQALGYRVEGMRHRGI
ncbi:MAG: IclR family transcriptional regulator [Anaerolineales bacterium]